MAAAVTPNETACHARIGSAELTKKTLRFFTVFDEAKAAPNSRYKPYSFYGQNCASMCCMRLFFVALAIFASVAFGSVVIGESIEEMAQAAKVIVKGTVVSSQPNALDGNRIYTYTELKVETAYKGKVPPAPILIRQPGGIIGRIGQEVSGVAKFAQGEQVILFLDPAVDEANVFQVRSLSAGKISLISKFEKWHAVRDVAGLSFARPQGAKTAPIAESDFGPLDLFEKRLKAALSNGAKR
jgi:hypothetical protein